MTEPLSDDELISAVLDGEATEDQRALVEGDPTRRARLDALRTLARATGAVAPPTDEQRDRAVASAMVAFSELAASGAPASKATRTAAARRPSWSRWSWSRRGALVGAAVAALVLLVPAAVLIARQVDSSPTADSVAARDPASPTTLPSEPGGSTASPTSTSTTSSTTSETSQVAPTTSLRPRPPVDLGSVVGSADLAEALEEVLPPVEPEEPPVVGPQPTEPSPSTTAPATSTTVGTTPPRDCIAELTAQGLLGRDPVLYATVVYDGVPALVVVSADDAGEVGTRRATVISQQDCTILARILV